MILSKKILWIFLLLGIGSKTLAENSTHRSDSVEIVNLLSEMIQINTVTGTEKPLGLYLTKWIEETDLSLRIFTEQDSAYNFMASLYPLSEDKPNYVFMGHIDVVPAEEQDWRYLPFSGKIQDGFVWGRGAIDDKGPVSMMLMALKRFSQKYGHLDLPYNISVLVLSGEELFGDNGAKIIADNFIHEINPVAMFGEGGSGMIEIVPSFPDVPVFGMSINEKTPLWLKVEAKAKLSGHSAAETELYAAKNLIKALLRIIDSSRPVKFNKLSKKMFKELGRMEGGFKGFMIKNSYKWYAWPIMKSYFREGGPFNILVSCSINVTEIRTESTSCNSIPQSAFATLDCRLLPGTSRKKFLAKLRLLAGNKVDISIIHAGIDAEDSPVNESFKFMENALLHNFENAKVAPFLFPASSDNNYFRSLKIPVYGITPMVTTNDIMQRIHNSNERMPIDQLVKGYDTFYTMMEMVQGVFVE